VAKIGIVGTGLIGASLGLAIKKSGGKDIEIVGTDMERSHSSKAQSMGAIDRVERKLVSATEDAEMVIIATPVSVMKDVMEIIAPSLMEGCLVTDTGASKGEVLEWAEQYLPRNVNFVGGHPLVGKGGSGPELADASLFDGRPYCVIPSSGARQDAVKLLTDMIRSIGGRPYFMDVMEHDSFVCAVSHLPVLVSAALVGCTAKSPSWADIAQLASTQYGDVTSLASGDPTSHRDIFLRNNEGTVHWIDAFIRELYDIRRILIGDEEAKKEALDKVFTEAAQARNRWIAGAVRPPSPDDDTRDRIPSATENMTSMFIGSSDARRRFFGWGGKGDRDKDTKASRGRI
jgi:prephenate dehydrogenase